MSVGTNQFLIWINDIIDKARIELGRCISELYAAVTSSQTKHGQGMLGTHKYLMSPKSWSQYSPVSFVKGGGIQRVAMDWLVDTL